MDFISSERLLTELVGFIGLILIVLCFQFDSRKLILLIQAGGLIFLAWHFYLLDQISAMVQELVLTLRNMSYAYSKYYPALIEKYQMYFFLLVVILTIIYTWEGYKTLLVGAATIIGTIIFSIENTRLIRSLMLIPPPCWLVFSIIVGSVSGTILAVILMGSVLVSIYRFDRKYIMKKLRLT